MLSADELRARREKLKAEREARSGKKEPDNVVQFPTSAPEVPDELADAIPEGLEDEKESLPAEILSADQELEAFVRGISVLEAYRKWVGGQEVTSGKDYLSPPEYRVQCPLPDHADNRPSASLNTDTNLWVCYTCDNTGGDVLDLAAINHGMYPGYKQGQDFHNLFRKIGEDYGWVVENQNGIPVPVSPSEQVKKYEAAQRELEEQRAQLTQQQGEVPPNNVIDITTGEEVEDDEDEDDPHFGDPFQLDWRPLVKEGTFLDEYMKACKNNFIPEEFHFWNALVAIGLAGGRNVKLEETFPNLFVCHLGPTSGGKSSSLKPLAAVLEAALPYNPEAPSHNGIYQMPSGASGEIIIDLMRGDVLPAATGKAPIIPIDYTPGKGIRGLIKYEELKEVLQRISRQGSTLQETLFKFYDCDNQVDTASRTSGISIAKNPFASLVTTTQPARLRKQLTKDDAYSGFLNRFVFTAGPQKPKPTRGRIPINLDAAIVQLKGINQWIDQLHNGKLDLQWSEEGGDRWDDFCSRTIHPTERNGSETVKRLNTVMIKLVMLFAINAHEDTVSVDSVNNAIGLWDYLLRTYKVIDDQVMVSSVTEMENDILGYIKKKLISGKSHVTESEVYYDRKHKYDRIEIHKAIEILVKMHELEEVQPPPGKKGGRPPKTAYKTRDLLA